ncbi:MAG: cyclase family protein [Acidothermales bacterium]|nr:cyclase family protein [Acidothermales bacterium]
MQVTRVVDLSVPVGPDTQVYPGDPHARLTVHSTIAEHGFNLLHVEMGSQTGTHVDAPYHVEQDAPTIDEVPLSTFVGPGVVADVRGAAREREPIGWPALAPYADALRPGVILLLHTGWSRHFGTDHYFGHPYLDASACRRVLDLGVRVIGIDATSPDETPDDNHAGVGDPVHHLIASAGGVIVENLRGLAAVDFPSPLVSVLPIALEHADGAPARAVAMRVEA